MPVFNSSLWLPRPRAEIFEFFANAENLEALTPAWLNFSILTPCPIAIGRGTLIDYRLKLRGIPFRWQTEITGWEPPHRFVDEQRRGPYRLWRHEHTFEEERGGTQVRDRVEYAVWGGWLVDFLFVRRDVRKIFQFREKKLRKLFAGNS